MIRKDKSNTARRYILPFAAVLLLAAAPAMAETAPSPAAGSLAAMWDKKPHGDKDHHGKKRMKHADWKADKEKMKSMSPAERAAFMERRHAERKEAMLAHIEKLPAGQQAEARRRMEEFEARREATRKELMALSPEQREARMEQMHKDMKEKHKAERAARFEKRWNDATADDRTAFCAKAAENCKGAEDDPRLCAAAKTKCTTP